MVCVQCIVCVRSKTGNGFFEAEFHFLFVNIFKKPLKIGIAKCI